MKLRKKILLVDDDELIAPMLARSIATDCGYETRFETDPQDIMTTIENWYPDVILLDINLPGRDGISILTEIIERGIDTKVVMLTADNTAEMAIKAMKIGATDYVTKPFDTDEVNAVIHNILERKRLKDEVDCLQRERDQSPDRQIIAITDTFKVIMETIAKLAKANVQTILITGESGTGKELLARHIHNLIHEYKGDGEAPFITLNCTALPEHLFESELFGYVKGAFTDAKTDQKGLFELADGGSILLDEIGDMKLSLQTKLLRVLEERCVRRVGGKGELPINMNVIATTNRDLSQAIKDGGFRHDLFYRLNTFPIVIPPLRDRPASIPLFAKHFLTLFAQKYNKPAIKSFSPEAEKILLDYSWPGNVRELKNAIERIVVLEKAEVIEPQHLPAIFTTPRKPSVQPKKIPGRYILPERGIKLDELEKDIFAQAFAQANQNMRKAADLLHVSYDSFRNHAKKYRLGN